MIIAVNVGGANPDAVEMLSRAGADIAFIDCERGGVGLDAATHLLRAARASGIAGVVRSWSKEPAILVQYLDRKADGLVIPHVDSVGEANAIVECVRYACGERSSEKLIIAQIESQDAVRAVEDLAQVEGLDAFLIGTNDLAYDMTGKWGIATPELDAAVDHVCEHLRAAKKPFGMPCRIADIRKFRERGGTIAYHTMEWLVERALSEFALELGRPGRDA
jgi:2-keto-3-deoxy-L-rhamnonate aldolase RhmA